MTSLLASGIYPPIPTFFDANEELDIATLKRHIHTLSDSGIAGYVLMGSNGEAVHLTQQERVELVQAAREAIADSTEGMPLIVGCGESSTRLTLDNCRSAAEHSADIALILPPFYYRGSMNKQALLSHYRAIADKSPLPILIYNMPANTGGLDLDASLICTLAEHANILGVKDSAGNIAKLAEIVANTPRSFSVLAGSASYLLPALAVGAHGAISALANVFPHEVCDVQALFDVGQIVEARMLQAKLIPANTAVTTLYGVSGLKAALELIAGYGGVPRLPLLPLTVQEHSHLVRALHAVHVAQETP